MLACLEYTLKFVEVCLSLLQLQLLRLLLLLLLLLLSLL